MVFPLLPPQFTPHRPCPVLLRRVAHLSESFAKAVSSIRLPALPPPAAVSDTCQCYLYIIVPSWDFPLFSPQSLPSTFCRTCLRCAACIGKWLSQAVLKPYIFLRGLLLLAGDVERNPGPIQGRQRELSVSAAYHARKTHNSSIGCGGGKCVVYMMLCTILLHSTRYLELGPV